MYIVVIEVSRESAVINIKGCVGFGLETSS